MFYERLQTLCKKNGTSITALVKQLDMSTSKVTAWKNGSIPNGVVLSKIAQHFGVSVDYLLGNEIQIDETAGTSYAMPVLSKEVAEMINSYDKLSGDGQEKAREYIEMLKDREMRDKKNA